MPKMWQTYAKDNLNIYQRYDSSTSREYIKNAINIHLCDFYKSVTKTAILMKSECGLSNYNDNLQIF